MNKEILEFCGIYDTHNIEDDKKEKILNVRRKFAKEIHKPINKVYVYDDYAWGKQQTKNKCDVVMLLDIRLKDLDQYVELLEKYNKLYTNIQFKISSLCQFERRKKASTEIEYYIYNYGILVYDDKRLTNISEKLVTNYGFEMDNYKYLDRYIHIYEETIDPSLCSLLKIYSLKQGFFYYNEIYNLEHYIQFIRLITDKNDNINNLIDMYLNTKTYEKKYELYITIKEYIINSKQKKFDLNLKYKPTMHIYELLKQYKENHNNLLFDEITPEELYIMYNIEQKSSYELASLYNVAQSKIANKRKAYNINIYGGFMCNDSFRKQIFSNLNSYSEYKGCGLLEFEHLIKPIIEYMSDKNIYLLHELLQFSSIYPVTNMENSLFRNSIPYYRSVLCTYFLCQNEFIEEIDYYTYKITSKGIELLNLMKYNDINSILDISNYFDDIKLYDIYFNEDDNEYFDIEDEEFSDNIDISDINSNEIYLEEKQINEITLTEISATSKKTKKSTSQNNTTNKAPKKTDFLKLNTSKMDIGKCGESLVLNYEKHRLISENRPDLADKVKWISNDLGDGAGYDILSYENINGKYEEIYIEVKSTTSSSNNDFEITINEINASNLYNDRYYIYRVLNVYSNKPVFYRQKGKIESNYNLVPINFKAVKK